MSGKGKWQEKIKRMRYLGDKHLIFGLILRHGVKNQKNRNKVVELRRFANKAQGSKKQKQAERDLKNEWKREMAKGRRKIDFRRPFRLPVSTNNCHMQERKRSKDSRRAAEKERE